MRSQFYSVYFTFRLPICYSSLVGLYKFRRKGLFLEGGTREDWGHPPSLSTVKKGPGSDVPEGPLAMSSTPAIISLSVMLSQAILSGVTSATVRTIRLLHPSSTSHTVVHSCRQPLACLAIYPEHLCCLLTYLRRLLCRLK